MIDLGTAGAGDPAGKQGLADSPGHVGEAFDIGDVQRFAVLIDEEEPVAAPGDVAGVCTQPGHVDLCALEQAIALDVVDGDGIRAFEADGDVPTGVSMRCAPVPMRPRCARATATPMVPCPHMPR